MPASGVPGSDRYRVPPAALSWRNKFAWNTLSLRRSSAYRYPQATRRRWQIKFAYSVSDKLKLVYTVLVLAALVYAERRLIDPRLTGARLSALVQEALVYKVLVYQEWHRGRGRCHAPQRRARNEYHNAVRTLRLDQHQLHRQKVSQALLANKSSDFWKEIRKVKGNGDTLPSVIDNMSKAGVLADSVCAKFITGDCKEIRIGTLQCVSRRRISTTLLVRACCCTTSDYLFLGSSDSFYIQL